MKPSFTRRYRRRSKPAKNEGAFFKKESSAEHGFFCEASRGAFFQPAVSNGQVVQRKCTCCDHSSPGEKEGQKVQRAAMDDKKEEDDKKLQRATDKKEEDDKKLMRVEEKKEEDKKLQRAPEKKEEDDKKLQRATDKKEEDDKKLMRAEAPKKEEEDKKLQKKESGATPAASHVGGYVSSLNGKGHSMSPLTNQFFAKRMGYDFSQVKVHTDKDAAESAKSVNAKAYTIGNNIVFNEGQYNTESAEGKKLLAHELTHVVQNGNEKSTIKRQVPEPALAEPAEEIRCEDEVNITTAFRNFLVNAPVQVTNAKSIDEARKKEMLTAMDFVIKPEGGFDFNDFTIFTCSKINNPLAVFDEVAGAEIDIPNKIIRLDVTIFNKVINFGTTEDVKGLTEFFQVIAHEKRHGTIGSAVQINPEGLNPGVGQLGAGQAAYRVEEIIVASEEIAIGRQMQGSEYRVPDPMQTKISNSWFMVEGAVNEKELARLRNLVITELRKRYGFNKGCDTAITLGVLSCMDFGKWHLCANGMLTGKLPDGIQICKNENGIATICDEL